MLSKVDEIVTAIIAMNHSWKRHRDLWGPQHFLASMLQDRKASLQVYLLREFPEQTYLTLDNSSEHSEELYSVRLEPPVKLASGIERSNAEHIPVRLASNLLTPEEIGEKVR